MNHFQYPNKVYTAAELEVLYNDFLLAGDINMTYCYWAGDDNLCVRTTLTQEQSDLIVNG